MADAKKKAAEKPSETSDKGTANEPIVRTVTYLAPGEAPDVQRDEPTLDPKLAEIRDAEAKANDKVTVEPRPEPTIDPELVKARDEQIKRETERAQSSK